MNKIFLQVHDSKTIIFEILKTIVFQGHFCQGNQHTKNNKQQRWIGEVINRKVIIHYY